MLSYTVFRRGLCGEGGGGGGGCCSACGLGVQLEMFPGGDFSEDPPPIPNLHLIAPAGFWPRGQNPRRHNRTPRADMVRKKNLSVYQKKFRFRVIQPAKISEIARKPAKPDLWDCPTAGECARKDSGAWVFSRMCRWESRQACLSQLTALNGISVPSQPLYWSAEEIR